MRSIRKKFLIGLTLSGIFFAGCKKWDDHNAVTDAALTKTLTQQISEDPALSKFSELLVKSGYDKVLASSKTFTVFAPTNTALASLDAATLNDSTKLNAFIGNHVATLNYKSTAAGTTQRIPMLNGKYQNFLNKTIGEATIVQADKAAANGILHVIDKMLPVLSNGWDALQNNSEIPAAQKAYMLSLFRNVFDATNAVQIGVDPSTGAPVYQPGTDSIQTNLFWRNIYDLRNEKEEYTLFVLTNAAWNSELEKYRPYTQTVTNDADSTTAFASWAVVKDLAIQGVYDGSGNTDTLLSKFSVKVPFEKASIVKTIKTSNGVIHIMDKVDVLPQHKIQPIIIQAENYRTTSIDRRSNTYFRDRFNPLTGANFRDVNVYNHGTALFNINYRVNNVFGGVKYKAYWVALNDFLSTSFSQKLALGTPTANTFTLQNANGYTVVTPNEYSEVLLGETTLPTYHAVLDVFLTAANSTAAASNPIVCDYIRLEPQF
ncbi:MAG TPA: fasciclin domain-containing protein [Flavisolibacter sp.]|jgi:uncharacterized surface protein with fasciclin (FAS1) repeats|nr:fasciclin domain-containing protein [Flavisolibacter sp.]